MAAYSATYLSGDPVLQDGFYVDQHNAIVWHNAGEEFKRCVWTDELAVWTRYQAAATA